MHQQVGRYPVPKHYVSVDRSAIPPPQNSSLQLQDNTEMEDAQYPPQASTWWDSVLEDPGQIDTFKFGGRIVHLHVDGIDLTPEDYDTKVKSHPEMMKKIGWPTPAAKVRVYCLTVRKWADEYDLCVDSYHSTLDAYLKALCYSELHDLGGTDPSDGPEDRAYIHQVPLNFPFYPSSFAEKHPELTAEEVSAWLRNELDPMQSQSPDGGNTLSSSSSSVESVTPPDVKASRAKSHPSTLQAQLHPKPHKQSPRTAISLCRPKLPQLLPT